MMVIPLVPLMSVNASAETSEELTAANTASVKTLKDGVTYFITQDLTINASKSNKNGLVVDNGATVTIVIPYGTTLTVYGKNGSGTTGGGAAILLPNGATLKIVGEGKLVAVGGNAGNGAQGGSGSLSIVNDNVDGHYSGTYGNNTVYFAGAGGAGGYGGGGAGAGIGTNGGSGGYNGGSGGSRWQDNSIRDYSRNGNSGSAGGSGYSASASGNLICAATIDMTGVAGGKAGSAGGSGSRGSDGYDGDQGDARGIAGGAGGGGGGGGLAGAAVGTGGGGGGQGGGGGSAGYIWSGNYVGGGGGGGGQGSGTSGGGAYGNDGAIPRYDCTNTRTGSVSIHDYSGSGGSGNINSYGSGGKPAYMTIKSDDGDYSTGRGGSGGRGGVSGASATVYTANDSSGKYINTYTITWIVEGVTSTEVYEYGQTPVFEGSTDKAADPEYTYTFAGWDNEIVPVTGDATYTATYNSSLRSYGASVGESLHGSVELTSTDALVGSDVTATITPTAGYEVDTVTVNGAPATKIAENQYTFTMPTTDAVVDVTYKKIPYNVDLFNDGSATGGNYSVDVESATVGDTVTITVTPKLGYLVDSVAANGVAAINNGDGTYSFVMPAQEVSITVAFDIDLPAIAKELQELNDADDELQNAIESGDNDLSDEIVALQAAITSAQTAIGNLDNAANTQLDALRASLASAESTLTDAIEALRGRVTSLEGALSGIDLSQIEISKNAIEALTAQLSTLKSTVDQLDTIFVNNGELADALETLKGEINAADSALNVLVNDLQTRVTALETAKAKLESAVAELQSAVSLKADAATVNGAIANLQAAIDALDAVKNNYVAADSALEANLLSKIEEAKTEAFTAAETLVSNAKAELEALIDTKANATEVNVALARLQSAIDALEAVKDNYAAADSALEARLETVIATAKSEAITAASEALAAAKNELNAAIALKADTATVNAALAELQSAIDALEAVKDNYVAADSALETELLSRIEGAKAEAITSAETLVNNAKAELESLIGTKANTVEVNSALAELQSAIDALEAVKDNYAIADSALEARLKTAIATAKSEAISAASEALTDAKNELNAAIALKADSATLNEKVNALASTIANAEAVANSALEANNSDKLELTSKIEAADAAMQSTIDALSAELDATNEKVAQLEAFIIVVCVLSCVAIGGCGVLAIFFLLGKRRIA